MEHIEHLTDFGVFLYGLTIIGIVACAFAAIG